MLRPKTDETQDAFTKRFLASPEAISQYADPELRNAAADIIWTHRATLANAKGAVSVSWPKLYSCRFIEPGLVHYADYGTMLVGKEALDRMTATFVGRPVINVVHKDLEPKDFQEQADGIVSRVWYNSTDGWYWCDYLVWDEATKKNCESKAYSVSCAYNPELKEKSSGVYHNIAYDAEITGGEYTHLAIVANPRYEGARIVVHNSIGGGPMKLNFWPFNKKESIKSMDAEKTVVLIGDKKVGLKNLLEAHAKQAAKTAPAAAGTEALENLADDTVIEIEGGKEVSLKDLKAAFLANEKDEDDKKKKDDEEKEKERKNAEDKDKEEKDKKDKEEKDKKDRENALRDGGAGRTSFADLKNKAQVRGDAQEIHALQSRADRVARGSERYGATKVQA